MEKSILLLNKLIPDLDLDISILNDLLDSYKTFNFNYFVESFKLKSRNQELEKINYNLIENEINNNLKIKKKEIECNNFWNNNAISNLDRDKFVSKQGIDEINKKMNHNLKIIIYDSKINLFYDIYFENQNDIIKFINEMNILINITLFIYHKINIDPSNSQLFCNFFLTNIKKKINWNTNEILGVKHVNSGLTAKKYVKIACDTDNYILIWRKEEFLKVYIHELIHFFNIDFNHISPNTKILNNKFCLDKNIRLIPNEAITDFTAIILKTVFYSFYRNRDLKEVLQIEIKFIIFQCIKILSYYNFQSWNDFFKSNNNECENLFNQESSIFSYYILKSLLFYNFNKNINLLKELNSKQNFYLNYNSTKNNFNKIIELQIDSLVDKSFSDIYSQVNKKFNFHDNSNKRIVNTIKMSYYDLLDL